MELIGSIRLGWPNLNKWENKIREEEDIIKETSTSRMLIKDQYGRIMCQCVYGLRNECGRVS